MMKLKLNGLAVGLAIFASTTAVNTATAGFDISVGGPGSTLLPTGQYITPTATPGSLFQPLQAPAPSNGGAPLPAGFAQSEALSPDGKTLLVLISGYNYVVDDAGKFLADQSTQYVFVFDVSTGQPVQKQIVKVSNSYIGSAFAPDGTKFYVPGAGEDNVCNCDR